MGFPARYGGGIAIPVRDKTGDVVSVQLRFDDPPSHTTPDGKRKKLRYLSPGGLDLRLDFPPHPLKPGEDIWITEGCKKADALRSLGCYALSVPGIWGWKGPKAKKDLTKISYEGHRVLIVFDRESKPRTKAEVKKARSALLVTLSRLGAEDLLVIDLPEIVGEEKTGVDDLLREGEIGIEELLRMAAAPEERWTHDIIRTERGEIRINHCNLFLILANDSSLSLSPRYNEFTNEILLGDRPLSESAVVKLASILEEKYSLGRIGPETMRAVLEALASENPFHPVREWLESLRWDGEPRLEGLFPLYYGAPSTEYTRCAGRNFLMGAVARIMDPGCQVDHAIVLEGEQGIRKSSSIWTLFGKNWYTTAYHDLASKDFKEGLIGFWGVEISELAAFRKSEVEIIKSEITRIYDDVRLAYRRDKARFLRQCVFIGTTNQREYLADETGNRRFWPIPCGNIDIEGLARDRELLFAEAVALYKSGIPWWEMPEETKDVQDSRYISDNWEARIEEWLKGKSTCDCSEILENCLGIEIGKQGKPEQTRVGHIMKRLGYIRADTTKNGRRWRPYVRE